MERPAYLELHRRGELLARLQESLQTMKNCSLCPRRCQVDRTRGETGFCGTGAKARVASFHAHFGEEATLVGSRGSGTIFMGSCNLLCSFCQNYEISHLGEGVEVEPPQLAAMMLELMAAGCHNINFVTPTHVIPQLLAGLIIAVEKGLDIPLVFNTGGYDRGETLRLLEGIFDIYLPDFKFWDNAMAREYCQAPDYRESARAAILEMHRQVGDLEIDRQGIAQRGLLIRHLIMPANVAGTAEIMDFIATEVSRETYVNLMDQYRPCGEARKDPLINRRPSREEISAALDAARRAGLSRLDGHC
ncbi:MAG: hypothetical protein QMD32_00295 [Smithellaceae bacterium]|nr:hypothetical protein [Smithellaceae bacterium]